MSQPLGAGWRFVLMALPMLAAACGNPVGLESRPCPCLMEAGFVCCNNTCIRIGVACPGQPAASADGAAGRDGPQDVPANPGVIDAPVDKQIEDARPPPDAMACGDPGGSCCPGNVCKNNGCCTGTMCIGAFDMCPGEAAACLSTTCGSMCGGLREACCGNPKYCVREWTSCQADRCQSCGDPGLPCCGRDCQPGTGTVCHMELAIPRCLPPPDGGASG